jgi:hypothetical protein
MITATYCPALAMYARMWSRLGRNLRSERRRTTTIKHLSECESEAAWWDHRHKVWPLTCCKYERVVEQSGRVTNSANSDGKAGAERGANHALPVGLDRFQ